MHSHSALRAAYVRPPDDKLATVSDAHSFQDDSTNGARRERGASAGASRGDDTARRNRTLRKSALFVLGGVVIFCLIGAFVAALYTKYLVAILMLGSAVFWLFPCSQWLYMAKFVPREQVDSAGVTLRPDRRFDGLSAAASITGIAVWGSWAAFTYLHMEGISDEGLRRFCLYMPATGAGICAVLVGLMIKRRGVGYVRLTPEGFVFADGMWAKNGRWSRITSVTDENPDRSYGWGPFKITMSNANALCPITVVMADRKKRTLGKTEYYVSDGDALRELIRFYWQRPRYRLEMTDDRALRRLRDGHFEAR